jgi:hypothetical protein
MKPSDHIQVAVDPATVRPGRPVLPLEPLEWPRYRRLRHAHDVPRLTRQVPTVEIMAGAALGFIAGLFLFVGRMALVDLGWCLIISTLFGLLIGWLIATYTGATGTLTWHTVLTNMIHIVWVLMACIFLAGITAMGAVMLITAFSDADRRAREDS